MLVCILRCRVGMHGYWGTVVYGKVSKSVRLSDVLHNQFATTSRRFQPFTEYMCALKRQRAPTSCGIACAGAVDDDDAWLYSIIW